MFQLIVIIIAIALSAVLALMGVYYGGDVFSGASEKSIYVRYQNEAVQIREAMRLYQIDNAVRMDKFTDNGASRDANHNFESLVDQQYLKDLSLKNAGWTIDKGVVRKPLDMTVGNMSQTSQLDRCKNFNTFASKNLTADGIADGCPLCSDVRYADYPACWNPGS